MDIYEYADQYPTMIADYYDPCTGYIYQMASYNQARRFGLPTMGIGVVDSSTGEFLGYAQRQNDDASDEDESVYDHDDADDHDVPPSSNFYTNVYALESGIGHAPKHVQEWFAEHAEFCFVGGGSVSLLDGKPFITVRPVDNYDESTWLEIADVQGTNCSNLDLAFSASSDDLPKFLAFRHNGGNINHKNGGYSICCNLKRQIRGLS